MSVFFTSILYTVYRGNIVYICKRAVSNVYKVLHFIFILEQKSIHHTMPPIFAVSATTK